MVPLLGCLSKLWFDSPLRRKGEAFANGRYTSSWEISLAVLYDDFYDVRVRPREAVIGWIDRLRGCQVVFQIRRSGGRAWPLIEFAGQIDVFLLNASHERGELLVYGWLKRLKSFTDTSKRVRVLLDRPA